MDFGEALNRLREGDCVMREGWNGKGQFVGLQEPDANSANTLPYMWLWTAQGGRVPWVPSQTDALATDWEVAPAADAPKWS